MCEWDFCFFIQLIFWEKIRVFSIKISMVLIVVAINFVFGFVFCFWGGVVCVNLMWVLCEYWFENKIWLVYKSFGSNKVRSHSLYHFDFRQRTDRQHVHRNANFNWRSWNTDIYWILFAIYNWCLFVLFVWLFVRGWNGEDIGCGEFSWTEKNIDFLFTGKWYVVFRLFVFYNYEFNEKVEID